MSGRQDRKFFDIQRDLSRNAYRADHSWTSEGVTSLSRRLEKVSHFLDDTSRRDVEMLNDAPNNDFMGISVNSLLDKEVARTKDATPTETVRADPSLSPFDQINHPNFLFRLFVAIDVQ
jgi:hypothetical protein